MFPLPYGHDATASNYILIILGCMNWFESLFRRQFESNLNHVGVSSRP